MTFDPAVIAAVTAGAGAAAVTSFGAWLVGRRKASGRVKTSEAESLWAEGRAFREDSLRRIAELETQTSADRTKCDGQLAELQRQLAEGMKERVGLERVVLMLEARLIRAGLLDDEPAPYDRRRGKQEATVDGLA